MKYQPIPRLGLSVYPERKQIGEQIVAPLIKLYILPFCLTVWHEVYRLIKVQLYWRG